MYKHAQPPRSRRQVRGGAEEKTCKCVGWSGPRGAESIFESLRAYRQAVLEAIVYDGIIIWGLWIM